MRTLIFALLSVIAGLVPLGAARALQDQPSPPAITSPLPGQVLQGSLPITVDTSVEGFQSAVLYFGYADDPTRTWFLIQTSEAPLANAVMAQWDTTMITDGNYILRLVVTRQGDQPLETLVSGLRVRNYSPVETDTPTPVTPTPSREPGVTPSPTATITPIPLTATPLPTNPAELTDSNITGSMGTGALVVLGIFALLGFYIWVRAAARDRK